MSSMTKEEAATMIETMISWYAFNGREAEALGMGVEALRPVSREQVEKVWPGCHECSGCKLCIWNETKKCNDCKNRNSFQPLGDFCPRCGKPLTDEVVEVTMKRLEALNEKD